MDRIAQIAAKIAGLDYKKVENLIGRAFRGNGSRWADAEEEVGFSVIWDSGKGYKVIGPVMGREKEVELPDAPKGWVTVGFLHNHTDGEEAALSSFDEDEARKHVRGSGIPLCMGVIGVDESGDGMVMETEWFEP